MSGVRHEPAKRDAFFWRGKNAADMSRSELVDALLDLHRLHENMRCEHRRQMQFLRETHRMARGHMLDPWDAFYRGIALGLLFGAGIVFLVLLLYGA